MNALAKPIAPLRPDETDVPRIPEHQLFFPIASGAYGQVWLGRNAVGTLRAIKIVRRDQHSADESFLREFKGLQKFEPISRTHEGLVDILSLGLLPENAGFYYVMELADELCSSRGDEAHSAHGGQNPDSLSEQSLVTSTATTGEYAPHTLRAELNQRGALPAHEVISLGIQLASALDHLHTRGLVHRDVKPSNILLVGGQPKLADAGLVTELDDARSLVGTAGYIAPEGPGTPQADLYALGKVLYEAAFGKDRQEFPALPAAVASSADHKQLIEINEIIAKACAHNPSQRYETATAMRSELELLAEGKSIRRRRASERGWRIAGRIAGVSAILLLVTAGAAVFGRWIRPSTKTALSSNPQAMVLYEQAKGMLNQRRFDVRLRAYAYLTEAVKRDPKFLDAYYMIFESYFSNLELPPYTNRLANEKWVAEKMRELAPDSAQYHTAMAVVTDEEWKWDDEIEHLKLALRANEHFVRAHGLYGGLLLRARADPQGSLQEFRAAERLDGFDSIIEMHLGTPYYVMGDYKSAIAQFQKSLDLQPTLDAWELLGLAYEANGQYREALDAFEKDEKQERNGDAAAITAQYQEDRAMLEEKGPRAVWEAKIRRLEKWWPDSYSLASLHARLGNRKEALAYLEKAFFEHHHSMPYILVHHYWRPFYGDPSFQKLVEDMGFTPRR